MPASVSGGIDKIFTEPPHEIRGLTHTDQAWIDETVEAGKTCCGWQIRPRPPELDRPRAVEPAIKPRPKKKRLLDRWRKKTPDA